MYVKIAEGLGLQDIRQDDWSRFVAPFWPAVIRSSLVPTNLIRLLFRGKTSTVRGCYTIYHEVLI